MNSENEDVPGRLLRLLSPIHERAVLTARQLRDRGVEHAEVSVSGEDVRILVKRARPE